MQALSDHLCAREALNHRLFETKGAKTWSLEEFKAIDSDATAVIEHLIAVADILGQALAEHGCTYSERSNFKYWSEVVDWAVCELRWIERRQVYTYHARIFLNGPVVGWQGLIPVTRDDQAEVRFGNATDELMTPLVEYDLAPGHERVNSVIAYEVQVPVDLGEEPYLLEYPRAAEVAGPVLDALRLCRPGEDIGVLGVELVRTEPFTPRIRKTLGNRYAGDLARSEPRRFDFRVKSAAPFAEDEVQTLRLTVAKLKSERLHPGLRQAVRRIGNAVERYAPDDPERVLEYAVALEAIYLNDGAKTEVSYRLCLRASRLLEREFVQRKLVFKILKDMYGFRSKIAHGQGVAPDDKKLLDVLEKVPRLVAQSVLRLLEEDFSPDSFWKRVELE